MFDTIYNLYIIKLTGVVHGEDSREYSDFKRNLFSKFITYIKK